MPASERRLSSRWRSHTPSSSRQRSHSGARPIRKGKRRVTCSAPAFFPFKTVSWITRWDRGRSENLSLDGDGVVRKNGQVQLRFPLRVDAVDGVLLSVGADEFDIFAVGKIGEVTGRLNGAQHGQLGVIGVAVGALHLAADKEESLFRSDGGGQMIVESGHIRVMNLLLQGFGRLAGGLDGYIKGQRDV